MRNTLSILLIGTILSCCDENDPATHIDTNLFISIMSGDGVDLLDPNNVNSFAEGDIRVYYEIEGRMEEVFNATVNESLGFSLLDQSDTQLENYVLHLNVNSSDTEEYPITYIQWNEVDLDTIKAQIYRGSNYEFISHIWYNGIDVSDEAFSGDSDGVIEIIK